MQEQTALSCKITNLQENLTPQRTEQAQLREREEQLAKIISETTQRLTQRAGIKPKRNRSRPVIGSNGGHYTTHSNPSPTTQS